MWTSSLVVLRADGHDSSVNQGRVVSIVLTISELISSVAFHRMSYQSFLTTGVIFLFKDVGTHLLNGINGFRIRSHIINFERGTIQLCAIKKRMKHSLKN